MVNEYDNLDIYTKNAVSVQNGPVSTHVDAELECSDVQAKDAASEHFLPKVLKAYKTNVPDKISEDQIVEYLPMIQRIVNKVVSYLTGPLSKEDLVSAGTIGLVKAARGFDSSKEADFKTYAYIRVRGAVIDELRKWSFTPSEVAKQIEQVRQIAIDMNNETGVVPSDEELAEMAGITVDRLRKIYEGARSQHFLSIHGATDESPVLGKSLVAGGTDMPEARMEKQEMLKFLATAIQELPEKPRRIIILYYHQELTMKEIAEVLGITESRVSQLHSSSIFKLSVKMSQYDDTRED